MILGEHLRPGSGPTLAFSAAGVIGLVGAAMFFAKFGLRSVPAVR